MSDANTQHALATDTVTIAWDAVQATPLNKVTGSTDLKFAVQRTSDSLWYDFNDDTFKAKGSVTTLRQSLTEVDATDAPGLYRYLWDLTDIGNANNEDAYQVIFEDTNSPKDVGFEPRMEIVVGSWSRQAAIDALYGDAVWIDVNNGSAGAVPLLNGTRDNPCNSPANAKTVADAIGRRHYKIINSGNASASVTFDGDDHTEWLFEGIGSGGLGMPQIEIDGIDVGHSRFQNVLLEGDFSGTTDPITHERGWLMSASSMSKYFGLECAITGPVTMVVAGQFVTFRSASAESPTPTISAATPLPFLVLMQAWDGLLKVNNLSAGGVVIARFGTGELQIGSGCTGGAVTYSGNVVLDEQSTPGDVIINRDGAFDPRHVNAAGLRTECNATGSTTTIPVPDLGPDEIYNGMRVVVEDVDGAVVEEQIISNYEQTAGGALITPLKALSFTPAAGDPVTIRFAPRETSEENTVLDNQSYVVDGTGKLLTTARRRIFRNAAAMSGVTKGGTDEGEIAETTITAEVGTNPNEPSLYKEVKS